MKRILIFVHRWLGVALAAVFLLWFPTGIVMMYRSYPEVTPRDRLEHAAAIDPSAIALTPQQAYARLDDAQPPAAARLGTFDGRPVYRFRAGRGERIVYADTGDEQNDVSDALMLRIASRWTGQPAAQAIVERPTEPDQWTVQLFRRGPLRKFSWPNGEQLYLSEVTGDVMQATTRADRVWAYLGAVPHWLYFTPLRRDGATWNRVVLWSSGIGTAVAILGMVVGVWMYSPAKRYRYNGAATSIPYRGQKRWHTMLGLLFGIGAITWAFSGLLSMEPFSPGEPPAGPPPPDIRQALRSRTDLAAFDARDPRAALSMVREPVKEMELTAFDGQPAYLATLAGGSTTIVPIDGDVRREFDRERMMSAIRRAAGSVAVTELRVVDRYDRYYLDRTRAKPLPVILARFDDALHTRYYVDPKTARIVGGYQDDGWINRWLYHGLHSMDFPWLYEYRPLWDIVVLTFMIGGTALCVTSIILAWRVLGRKLRQLVVPRRSVSRPLDDDLAVAD